MTEERDPPGPPVALNRGLRALAAGERAPAPLDETPLIPGLRFRLDPEGGVSGRWSSPRGRILELEAEVAPGAGGRWLGLHLELPELGDLAGIGWLGFALRGAAARPLALRPCLRSGRTEAAGGGFHDLFFTRHVLLHPAASDHHDLCAPPRVPDLWTPAPWRELILFLPPGEGLHLSLHEVQVIAQ